LMLVLNLSGSELTIQALMIAYEKRGKPKGVIFYSD
jgi:hypothetical protein